MKFDVKPFLLLITTLLLGFIIGVLANGSFVRSKIRKLERGNVKKEFRTHFLRGLDLSEEQNAQVQPILEEHFLKMQVLRKQFRSQTDSLYLSLAPIMNEKQQKILEKRRKRRPNKSGHHRRGPAHRPPHPEAPPH